MYWLGKWWQRQKVASKRMLAEIGELLCIGWGSCWQRQKELLYSKVVKVSQEFRGCLDP